MTAHTADQTAGTQQYEQYEHVAHTSNPGEPFGSVEYADELGVNVIEFDGAIGYYNHADIVKLAPEQIGL